MTTENSNIERPEYYGYFVTHAYMSQIQRGIQAAHVIQQMYGKMEDSTPIAQEAFREWATQDFTMIVLNGGNSAMLQNSYHQSYEADEDGSFPIARFFEDSQSMEGMMTAWGIVLPSTCKLSEDDDPFGEYSRDQEIYYTVLANLKLA